MIECRYDFDTYGCRATVEKKCENLNLPQDHKWVAFKDWILQQNDASSSSGAEQQKKDKRQNLDLRAVVHPFNELTERRENFYALISKGINSKDDADVAE